MLRGKVCYTVQSFVSAANSMHGVTLALEIFAEFKRIADVLACTTPVLGLHGGIVMAMHYTLVRRTLSV